MHISRFSSQKVLKLSDRAKTILNGESTVTLLQPLSECASIFEKGKSYIIHAAVTENDSGTEYLTTSQCFGTGRIFSKEDAITEEQFKNCLWMHWKVKNGCQNQPASDRGEVSSPAFLKNWAFRFFSQNERQPRTRPVFLCRQHDRRHPVVRRPRFNVGYTGFPQRHSSSFIVLHLFLRLGDPSFPYRPYL